MLILQVFDLSSPDDSAVNCVSFISDQSFVCGTQEGTVAVYDLRNTRYMCLLT